MIMDYEHAAEAFFLRSAWEIVPDVVRDDSIRTRRKDGIRRYSGIKEDVYVPISSPTHHPGATRVGWGWHRGDGPPARHRSPLPQP